MAQAHGNGATAGEAQSEGKPSPEAGPSREELSHDFALGMEPKRKRFRAFRVVRKIFRRKPKFAMSRGDTDDDHRTPTALKSRSTSELLGSHRLDDDRRSSAMSGLSLSHDSVFTPDTVEDIKSSRVRDSLKEELARKLGTRQESDDDDDVGLPRSPCTSPTTNEVLRQGLMMGKSKKFRSSDGSLLSMGSSETDNEDGRDSSMAKLVHPRTQGCDPDLDVGATVLLDNHAALHKLSVKPRRTHAVPQHRRVQQVTTVVSLPTTPEDMEEPSISVSKPKPAIHPRSSRGTTSSERAPPVPVARPNLPSEPMTVDRPSQEGRPNKETSTLSKRQSLKNLNIAQLPDGGSGSLSSPDYVGSPVSDERNSPTSCFNMTLISKNMTSSPREDTRMKEVATPEDVGIEEKTTSPAGEEERKGLTEAVRTRVPEVSRAVEPQPSKQNDRPFSQSWVPAVTQAPESLPVNLIQDIIPKPISRASSLRRSKAIERLSQHFEKSPLDGGDVTTDSGGTVGRQESVKPDSPRRLRSSREEVATHRGKVEGSATILKSDSHSDSSATSLDQESPVTLRSPLLVESQKVAVAGTGSPKEDVTTANVERMARKTSSSLKRRGIVVDGQLTDDEQVSGIKRTGTENSHNNGVMPLSDRNDLSGSSTKGPTSVRSSGAPPSVARQVSLSNEVTVGKNGNAVSGSDSITTNFRKPDEGKTVSLTRKEVALNPADNLNPARANGTIPSGTQKVSRMGDVLVSGSLVASVKNGIAGDDSVAVDARRNPKAVIVDDATFSEDQAPAMRAMAAQKPDGGSLSSTRKGVIVDGQLVDGGQGLSYRKESPLDKPVAAGLVRGARVMSQSPNSGNSDSNVRVTSGQATVSDARITRTTDLPAKPNLGTTLPSATSDTTNVSQSNMKRPTSLSPIQYSKIVNGSEMQSRPRTGTFSTSNRPLEPPTTLPDTSVRISESISTVKRQSVHQQLSSEDIKELEDFGKSLPKTVQQETKVASFAIQVARDSHARIVIPLPGNLSPKSPDVDFATTLGPKNPLGTRRPPAASEKDITIVNKLVEKKLVEAQDRRIAPVSIRPYSSEISGLTKGSGVHRDPQPDNLPKTLPGTLSSDSSRTAGLASPLTVGVKANSSLAEGRDVPNVASTRLSPKGIASSTSTGGFSSVSSVILRKELHVSNQVSANRDAPRQNGTPELLAAFRKRETTFAERIIDKRQPLTESLQGSAVAGTPLRNHFPGEVANRRHSLHVLDPSSFSASDVSSAAKAVDNTTGKEVIRLSPVPVRQAISTQNLVGTPTLPPKQDSYVPSPLSIKQTLPLLTKSTVLASPPPLPNMSHPPLPKTSPPPLPKTSPPPLPKTSPPPLPKTSPPPLPKTSPPLSKLAARSSQSSPTQVRQESSMTRDGPGASSLLSRQIPQAADTASSKQGSQGQQLTLKPALFGFSASPPKLASQPSLTAATSKQVLQRNSHSQHVDHQEHSLNKTISVDSSGSRKDSFSGLLTPERRQSDSDEVQSPKKYGTPSNTLRPYSDIRVHQRRIQIGLDSDKSADVPKVNAELKNQTESSRVVASLDSVGAKTPAGTLRTIPMARDALVQRRLNGAVDSDKTSTASSTLANDKNLSLTENSVQKVLFRRSPVDARVDNSRKSSYGNGGSQIDMVIIDEPTKGSGQQQQAGSDDKPKVTDTDAMSGSQLKSGIAKSPAPRYSLPNLAPKSTVQETNVSQKAIAEQRVTSSIEIVDKDHPEKIQSTPQWMKMAQQRRDIRKNQNVIPKGHVEPVPDVETVPKPTPGRSSRVLDMVSNLQKQQVA